MRRTPALAVTATTALLLTACTGGDPASTPAPGSPAADAGAGAAPDSAGDEPFPGSTEECLLGTWRLDLGAMQDDLRAMLASGDGAVEVVVEGTTTYEFGADGVFGAAVDSSSSMTMSSDGDDLVSTSTSTGDLTGTWTLTDDQLIVSDVDPGALDVTTTATLGGEPLDVPAGSAQDAIEALPPTASAVTCTTGTLTLVASMAADESSDPVSLTYTLRR